MLHSADLKSLHALAALLPHIESIEARRGGNPVGNFETYFPDLGPYRRELYPQHMQFFAGGRHFSERLFMAANRVGKALRHGTPVATPTGWRPIEALKPGDPVIAGDGTMTLVTAVYPQGRKPMARIEFDVGEVIECCAEHLWLYQHPRARYPYRRSHRKDQANPFHGEWVVANTETIRRQVGDTPITRQRVVIPTCEPWRLPPAPTPIDPYLLGILLGDGCIREGIRFSTQDAEIVEAVRAAVPYGVSVVPCGGCDYGIRLAGGKAHGTGGVAGRRSANALIASLTDLGIMGLGAASKHVPKSYLFNEIRVRIAVLQGLMDTDGSIGRSGAMEFSTISPQLADDVEFLVHSLGGKVSRESRQTHFTHKGEYRAGAPSIRLRIRLADICPFRLSRKAARWSTRVNTKHRIVHRISDAPEAECSCIEVEHPSHTYVTACGIVTHNTEAGAYEMTAHMTGLYPPWWEGRRFKGPIEAWLAGDTGSTTRDIIQRAMLGPFGQLGAGMVPSHLILGSPTRRHGIPEAYETFWVRHVPTGGISKGWFKSYDQRRQAFQGTAKHIVWLDEEPDDDGGIYAESATRTMVVDDGGTKTSGIVYVTATPLRGLSIFIKEFMEKGVMHADDGALFNAEQVWSAPAEEGGRS